MCCLKIDDKVFGLEPRKSQCSFGGTLARLRQHLRDWWIRNLDPSYRGIRLEDMRSIADLAGIAYDAGAQLGAGHLNAEAAAHGSPTRKQALGAILKLEKQYRREATILIDHLLRGWRELGGD